MRIDVFLAENGLAQSREKAKMLVKSSRVTVNGKVCTKPSEDVCAADKIEVDTQGAEYVGRGYLKLETAFKAFELDINNKACADIGASTGGFTQYMLLCGARKVYAIDVGHGQLDKSIASDERVVNCEGVNARYLTRDLFEELPEFMSVDISFISLRLVLPALMECLADEGELAVLIKPQFEAGKAALGKNGIVKDKKVHVRILNELFEFFAQCGAVLMGVVPSGIRGGDGNIEYLAHLKKTSRSVSAVTDVKMLADRAFNDLRDK